MLNPIMYEQPLNERIRVFLRMEHYFAQTLYFQAGQSTIDIHAGVSAFIEIINILDRNDVRCEILKELDRQILSLSRLLDTPGIDRNRLDTILKKLRHHLQQIHSSPSKLVQDTKDNELLNSIRQRVSISAGICGFDLPAYHYFLNLAPQLRQAALGRWLTDVMPLKEGIDLLLSLMRNSNIFERHVAESGFYQRNLEMQNTCQLVRIQMPERSLMYPEVSGSKHRVSVRFLQFAERGRPQQVSEPQEFDICFCTF